METFKISAKDASLALCQVIRQRLFCFVSEVIEGFLRVEIENFPDLKPMM